MLEPEARVGLNLVSMATFTKKSGAPAGVIRYAIGGTSVIFDDGSNASFTTNDPNLIYELSHSPYLSVDNSGTAYAPPTLYKTLDAVQGSYNVGDVLTLTSKGWEGKPPTGGGGGSSVEIIDNPVLFQGSNSASVNDHNALQTAIDTAIAGNRALFISPGKHRIDGAVHWDSQLVRVYGAGSGKSILNFNSGTTYAAFKIGPDSAGGPGVGPGDWPQGFVQDFSIWANDNPDSIGNDSPSGGYGLQLSQTHPDVIRMDVRGFNVGFDLVGNCYGTRFASCWAKYGWNNYGLLLREGDQNGQDITFDNCWFSGRKGGVVMCGWGAGYHFRGGQIGSGTSNTGMYDWRGSLLIGPGWSPQDPNLGASGSVRNVTLVGVNFESPIGMWAVRTFEPQFQVIFDGCHFMGSPIGPADASAPHGVWKSDNFYDGSLVFRNCSYHRYWRGVSDLAGDTPGGTHIAAWKGSLAPAPASPMFLEDYPVVRDLTVHNLDLNASNAQFKGRGILSEAGIWNLGGERNNQYQLGPLRLQGFPNGTLKTSTDFGYTDAGWKDVRESPVRIDAAIEGMPFDGSTDSIPTWDAIKAKYPNGGTIHLPQNAAIRVDTPLDLSAAPWFIEGNGSALFQPVSSGKAILVMHRRTDGYRVGARNLKIVGAGVGGGGITVSNHASAPTGQVGFVARDGNFYENVTVNNCDMGFVAGGNHSTFIGVSAKNNRYNHVTGHGTEGYVTAQTDSGTHGNNTYYSCDFTGGLVSSYVLGNGMIDASAFYSCHWGAARDCFLFAAKNGQENALGGGTVFVNAGLEYWGRSIITDEGFNTGNRRMSSRTTWIGTGVSDPDPAFLPSGDTQTYMVRCGLIKDWKIQGGPGDDFNHNFSHQSGFEFEACNNFEFEGADLMISRCRNAGVLPFRLGGSGPGNFNTHTNIVMYEANREWKYLICKVEAGQSVAIEKGVALKWNDSLDALNSEVRHWDFNTGMAVGIAGFNATAGQLVPVVVKGSPIGAAYIFALPDGYVMGPGEVVVPDRGHPGFITAKAAYNSREGGIGQAWSNGYTDNGAGVFRTKIAVNTVFG